MSESPLRGIVNRVCQHIARFAPGARSLRVSLHRWRGAKIGKGVWIGYDVILETSYPWLVTIEEGATLSVRVTVIAHFRETRGVTIGRNAFIGPGAILLPGITIGDGAVVTAGSVVNRPVPPMTVVQGNPAVPVANCGVPLRDDVTLKQFSRSLKPISSRKEKPQ